MIKEKNLLLVDLRVSKNWAFIKELRKDSIWDLKSCVNNAGFYHTGIGKFFRYLLYFLFPLYIVFIRKRYNIIIGWQQFYALNLSFWLRLFHLKKINKIVVMTFIYKDRKGLIGRMYRNYISYCLKSGHISQIICHSKFEVSRYQSLFDLPDGILHFVPLGIDDDIEKQGILKGDYVFSTGRSNRDYERLLDLFKNSKYKLKIACEEDFGALPSTIEVLHNCYDREMFKILKECFCICILLKEPDISSGQLVILQAMQCGKPVIINRCSCIIDYIKDGVNGFIVDSNDNSVIDKLQLLCDNSKLYNEMSENCRVMFKRKFTIESLANGVLNSVKYV